MTPGTSLLPLLALLTSIVLGAAGQVLLKLGVDDRRESAGRGNPLTFVLGLVRSGRVVLGIALYAISALLWFAALVVVDLSYAFPLLALNMVLIGLGARFVLGEEISSLRWACMGVIAVGIGLVAAS